MAGVLIAVDTTSPKLVCMDVGVSGPFGVKLRWGRASNPSSRGNSD